MLVHLDTTYGGVTADDLGDNFDMLKMHRGLETHEWNCSGTKSEFVELSLKTMTRPISEKNVV